MTFRLADIVNSTYAVAMRSVIVILCLVSACAEPGPSLPLCRDVLGTSSINRDAYACSRSGLCEVDGAACCMAPIGGADSDSSCGFPALEDCCEAWRTDNAIQACADEWLTTYSASICINLHCGSPQTFDGYSCRDGLDCPCAQ